MSKFKVGVIGNGFVGEAQIFAFSPTTDLKVFDIDPLKSTHTLLEVLSQEFIFVCLPTPMKENGEQDLSYIENFFNNIGLYNTEAIFILKSTVLPGTTKQLKDKFNFNIVFCPEFLTERTAKLDILSQARVIFGGERHLTNKVEQLFSQRFANRHYIHTDPTTAEFIKYMNNTFFATKVSLMNEFYRMSKILNIDWETAKHGFASDGRVGDSHMHVPGHDGKLGFGGTCFPKDINALITLGKELNTPMNVLEAAWKTNLEVRPEEDWKQMKGRAVS